MGLAEGYKERGDRAKGDKARGDKATNNVNNQEGDSGQESPS
jgi:hypothetical protein